MIRIKDLTENDVNRIVVYRNGVGNEEEGFIRSWNERFVFVVYGINEENSKATYPHDLSFKTNVCAECGSTNVSEYIEDYEFPYNGENFKVKTPVIRCHNCKFRFLDYRMEDITDKAIEEYKMRMKNEH